MKKKFVYLFTIGNKIHWSGDDENVLVNRGSTGDDRAEIREFIDTAEVGNHLTISTGEFIFRTA
jgi:hypothetical protein